MAISFETLVLAKKAVKEGLDNLTGLSTNDYTDEDKAKLAGIEEGAEKNRSEIIVSDETPSDENIKLWFYQTPHAKIEIPTMAEHNALAQTVNAKPNIDLDVTGAAAGQFMKVKTVDANGKPTAWETEPIMYTLTVTVLTQDGVTVTGQTVTVREGGADGQVFATATYDGQPVSFALPVGFAYYISVSNNLASHFNPTTATGIVTNTNIAVTLTYSDFSSIRTARDIQAALNADIDLTELVGEQISCPKGNSTLTWDVADYEPELGEITLLVYDTLPAQLQFEPAQALAYFEHGLPAGDYKFKNGNTYYYFTLTKAIPEGGQLKANTSGFQTYEIQSATATLETGTVSATEISGATDLGTAGAGELNHMDRVNNGSNNYGEAGLRQWLNSYALASTPMPRINKFSRPYVVAEPGFLSDLDPDFVACLADTEWKCSANNVYEAPASMGGIAVKSNPYTVTDKIGLASEMEIFGSYGGVQDGSKIFDLYVGASADDRKKYYNNAARSWWLRSPHWSNAYNERYVTTNGTASNVNAFYSYGVVPACKIKKSI